MPINVPRQPKIRETQPVCFAGKTAKKATFDGLWNPIGDRFRLAPGSSRSLLYPYKSRAFDETPPAKRWTTLLPGTRKTDQYQPQHSEDYVVPSRDQIAALTNQPFSQAASTAQLPHATSPQNDPDAGGNAGTTAIVPV
ncbi:hypothetical protein EYZ11_011396 [Aspergillus tanneri]|uniref:Uncharacterized protein n=1 Tax=Aspergillus tanneri TaxID=1220188 RepID=A0A4S3J2X9_9EURO|nr:hypothetical protein EYZ11_011396 [Aspergillus tanneri]